MRSLTSPRGTPPPPPAQETSGPPPPVSPPPPGRGQSSRGRDRREEEHGQQKSALVVLALRRWVAYPRQERRACCSSCRCRFLRHLGKRTREDSDSPRPHGAPCLASATGKSAGGEKAAWMGAWLGSDPPDGRRSGDCRHGGVRLRYRPSFPPWGSLERPRRKRTSVQERPAGARPLPPPKLSSSSSSLSRRGASGTRQPPC